MSCQQSGDGESLTITGIGYGCELPVIMSCHDISGECYDISRVLSIKLHDYLSDMCLSQAREYKFCQTPPFPMLASICHQPTYHKIILSKTCCHDYYNVNVVNNV